MKKERFFRNLVVVMVFLLSTTRASAQLLDPKFVEEFNVSKTEFGVVAIHNSTNMDIEIVPYNDIAILINGAQVATTRSNISIPSQVKWGVEVSGIRYREQNDFEREIIEEISEHLSNMWIKTLADQLIVGVKVSKDGASTTWIVKTIESAGYLNLGKITITDEDLGTRDQLEFKSDLKFSVALETQYEGQEYFVVLDKGKKWNKSYFSGTAPFSVNGNGKLWEFKVKVKFPDYGWKRVLGRDRTELAIVNGKMNVTLSDILGKEISSPSEEDGVKTKTVYLHNRFGRSIVIYLPGEEDGNQAVTKDRSDPISLNPGEYVKKELVPGVYSIFYMNPNPKNDKEDYLILSDLTVSSANNSRQEFYFTKNGISAKRKR